MSPKKKSNKKSKSAETGKLSDSTSLSDSNSFFGSFEIDVYSKIIKAAVDAGFSNKEASMAYDKFRNEGRITEDIELTTNKLICYLKVDHF